MALQLYHGYGSKHLIETIHAFGICASYTEVRQFLTSAANHEIAKTEVSCIPYGISHKTLDSDFIQEGADNIDLNTETIDGKNNMHSMARAVFQVVQDHTRWTLCSQQLISIKLFFTLFFQLSTPFIFFFLQELLLFIGFLKCFDYF